MPTVQKHVIQLQAFGAIPTAQKTKKVSTEIKNLQRAISQLKAGMLGMRGLMIGAAGSLVALGLGLRRTVSAYSDYTRAQSQLRTTLAATTNAYRQNARISSVVAERAAINLGYSTTEANEAMTTMIQTGIGVHASMRLIGSSLRLARVGEMDTNNATRFLVDTMNMFRGEMAQNNMTLREFADTMSGQLAVAANMSSTNIEQLQQAFRYAGTEMSALGYRSHEVMSALAGLSVVGLRGTTAGTRLRGAVAALIRPSEQVKQQIDRVTQGVGSWSQIVHDEHGNLRRLPDMMAQLMQIMARLPTQQQRAQLEVAIFGRRALAAGISLSEYNQAAQRMLQVNTEIQNSERVRARIMRMEEERMRGFHVQVQQLKEGLTDLGIAFGEILFGAMDDSRQGFGTYVREVVRAIRLIGMLEDGHEDVRGEFEELSPRVRETATEMREFLISVANLIKALGKIAKGFLWVSTNFPRTTAAVIGLRVAFGGFIPMFGALSRAAPRVLGFYGRLIGSNARLASTFRISANATKLFSGGLVHLTGMAMRFMSIRAADNFFEWTMGLGGINEEMEDIRSNTVAVLGNYLEWIPVLGPILAMITDIAGAAQRAAEAFDEMWNRRRRDRERQIDQTAEQLVTARMERQGTTRASAMATERSSAMQRLATLIPMAGRGDIARTLHRAGATQEQIPELTNQIMQLHRSLGRGTAGQAAALAGGRGEQLSTAISNTVRQMNGFEAITRDLAREAERAARAMSQMQAPETAADVMDAVAGDTGVSIPTAQDAYVNRGGLMGVSSGDIVVSRRHLANAVLARQGAMAGSAVSMAGEGMMVGPSPTVPGGGGGGTMNISIPVMLDGREIARAVGRANVTQLERGGGRLPPGQRRSLRETGFSRAV